VSWSRWSSTSLTLEALVFLLALILPLNGEAQMTVRVVDQRSGFPIPLASVVFSGADGRALVNRLTNDDGITRVEDVLGATHLTIEALGYQAVSIALPSDRDVRIRLHAAPIDLDSLRVTVRSSNNGRTQFSLRRQQGDGIFLDPLDVSQKIKHRVSDIFYEMPGVRRSFSTSDGEPKLIPSLGRGCLNFRVDNQPVRLRTGQTPWANWPLSSVLPSDVMAVEVYRFFGEVPLELRHEAAIGGGPCGLVVIWTKVGW
jgi:hypothetical protein